MKYKHLFGPVHSRRLGLSLGVDLVPFKYCPLNCVYCEAQRTTHLTLERVEFFPLEEIISELDDFLNTAPALDYITFSGAGEPTLYSRIGEMIAYIKKHYPQYKLALLTNGVLLNDKNLLAEIIPCDLILPSLDACREETYTKINRPHPSLSALSQVEGLVALRNAYKGQIWLEIFIIAGINDSVEELDCFVSALQSIKPDRVQINSLDRPGAEEWVKPAGHEVLENVWQYLATRLEMPVEIIAKQYQIEELDLSAENYVKLKEVLTPRQHTAEQISEILGWHINEVSKILRRLHADGDVEVKREASGVFYKWKF